MRHLFTLGAIVVLVAACGGTSTIGRDKGGADDQDSGTGVGKGGSGGDDPGVGTGGKPNPGSGGGSGSQCSDTTLCAAPAVCKVCPDGTYSCASASCVNGACEVSYPDCAPAVECQTSADCGVPPPFCEICVDGTQACPGVIECVDGKCAGATPSCPGSCDPANCPVAADPANTGKGCCLAKNGPCGVDYGEGCVPAGTGNQCTNDADCPAAEFCPACPDGSCAKVYGVCEAGQCTTKVDECPGSGCGTDFDCPVPAICQVCPDGTCAPTYGICEAGKCTTRYGTCGGSGPLQWYTTCGDPVCRVPPPPGDPSVPPCNPAIGQKVGGPCEKAGEVCNPGLGCGEELMCASSDPTSGGNCPI